MQPVGVIGRNGAARAASASWRLITVGAARARSSRRGRMDGDVSTAGADLVIAGLGADGGRRVAVKPAASRDACPVQALKDWLATSETSFGPVFRKIDRWGNIEHRRLGTDALRRILMRRTLRRGRNGKAAAA